MCIYSHLLLYNWNNSLNRAVLCILLWTEEMTALLFNDGNSNISFQHCPLNYTSSVLSCIIMYVLLWALFIIMFAFCLIFLAFRVTAGLFVQSLCSFKLCIYSYCILLISLIACHCSLDFKLIFISCCFCWLSIF